MTAQFLDIPRAIQEAYFQGHEIKIVHAGTESRDIARKFNVCDDSGGGLGYNNPREFLRGSYKL